MCSILADIDSLRVVLLRQCHLLYKSNLTINVLATIYSMSRMELTNSHIREQLVYNVKYWYISSNLNIHARYPIVATHMHTHITRIHDYLFASMIILRIEILYKKYLVH